MTSTDLPPLSELKAPGAQSALNRLVLDYWWSLRDGNALPNRSDFDPAQVRPALSRLCIFEARRGESVNCRLAGSGVRHSLGFDLTGMDYRQYTPREMIKLRLDAYSNILDGMAMRNVRQATLNTGEINIWEELVLPFGDTREDGSQHVLIIAEFPLLKHGERVVSPIEVTGPPRSFQFYRAAA
jgi:hypothetical protein